MSFLNVDKITNGNRVEMIDRFKNILEDFSTVKELRENSDRTGLADSIVLHFFDFRTFSDFVINLTDILACRIRSATFGCVSQVKPNIFSRL